MKTGYFLVWLFVLTLGTMHVQAQERSIFRLSTHMLDITRGEPASGVEVVLFRWDNSRNGWMEITKKKTAESGRVEDLLPGGREVNGMYKLKFETKPYFQARQQDSIYPYVEITFEISGDGHYHIPITMSANGYSTYRGS